MSDAPIDPFAELEFEAKRANLSPEEYARRLQKEVTRRRDLIAGAGQGFEVLPPDIADMLTRDLLTGRVRQVRGGSTRSAIGGAFDMQRPLGASSILGDV